MKKVFLAAIFIASAFISNAQIRKIPSEVTDAFKTKYPNAQTVSWKDKVTSFEASFIDNKINVDAYFDSKGNWIETDKTWSYETIPDAVKDGFNKSKYKDDWDVKDVVEIERPDMHQFRLTVKKNDVQLKYLYFETDGKLAREALTL